MVCMSCNRQIPDDSLFCPYCGAKVIRSLKCLKCNRILPDDSSFCPYCGEKVNFNNENQSGVNNTIGVKYDKNTSLQITFKLLEFGREYGGIKSNRFIKIPEIMIQNKLVCTQIFNGITQLAEVHPKIADPMIYLKWCCYAGMGAVFLWNKNSQTLKQKGIYQSLVEERGLFTMDEFVLDLIGIGYKSKDYEKLNNMLWYIAILSLGDSSSDNKYQKENFDYSLFIESLIAMFNFGMVYELNRQGIY